MVATFYVARKRAFAPRLELAENQRGTALVTSDLSAPMRACLEQSGCGLRQWLEGRRVKVKMVAGLEHGQTIPVGDIWYLGCGARQRSALIASQHALDTAWRKARPCIPGEFRRRRRSSAL